MDNTEPRHVDRRDQGLRRQRLVTQAAAIGAAVLSIAFGWVFAQGSSASAEDTGTDSGPAAPAAVETSQSASPKASKSAKAPKASKSPKAAKTTEQAEEADEEEPEQEEPATQLKPPPAAPEPTQE